MFGFSLLLNSVYSQLKNVHFSSLQMELLWERFKQWWEIAFFAFSRLLYLIKPKCIVYKNIKHVNDKQDQELYCKEHYQKVHEKDDFLVFRKAQQYRKLFPFLKGWCHAIFVKFVVH